MPAIIRNAAVTDNSRPIAVRVPTDSFAALHDGSERAPEAIAFRMNGGRQPIHGRRVGLTVDGAPAYHRRTLAGMTARIAR